MIVKVFVFIVIGDKLIKNNKSINRKVRKEITQSSQRTDQQYLNFVCFAMASRALRL